MVTKSVFPADVDCVLHAVLKQRHTCVSQTLASQLTESFSTPEILVAVIFDKLSSSDIASMDISALTNLKNIMSSETSLSAEYFYPSAASSLSASLVQLVNGGARRAKLVNLHLSTRQTIKVDVIMEQLKSESGLFANGVTDLILLHVSDQSQFAAVDILLPSLIGLVSERTRGNFVALISANAASAEIVTYTGPQYITSPILLGLLISGFLVAALAVAINIVMSIEAPVRFPRRLLTVKKEY